ncbi:hypothetical protein DRP04_08330 [Archaeoglobales archaeon]|nr:MAG: hypothetical protein DRP04_08330 [Archaeoglobales archaeon]
MVSYISGSEVKTEPNLLFDKSDSSAVHSQAYWGLRKFGPYDKDVLKKINLAIITPSSKLEDVRRLIQDLNNGTPIMPGGMPRFFRCHIDVVDELTIESTTLPEYQHVAQDFVNGFDPKEIDVVLAYIPKSSRYFTNTPYYRLKAILATHGFPSQMITENTFTNLKWSYLNLASAIFSKAGGVPWVLESEMKNTDILIGISASNLVSKKVGQSSSPRYVGYVNVFDSYGKWMFFEGTAKPYSKENRLEQFSELLNRALSKFKSEKGYYPQGIVIHYYKKWGKTERNYVLKILDDLLDEYNVCFVSIDDSHPFRLFDMSTPDGSFPRGSYVFLSENEILLSTTGYAEIGSKRMGTPKLLRIRAIQHPEAFITLDEIAEQVLALTKLNWATATPIVREPVTLLFSREIAYLTAAVSEQEWESLNKSEVNVVLNKKPWFI